MSAPSSAPGSPDGGPKEPPRADAVGRSAPIRRADTAEVIGVIGAPIVLLCGLSIKYAVVQVIDCTTPFAGVVVHVVVAITLVVCVWTTGLAVRRWRTAGLPHARAHAHHARGDAMRRRTMGMMGTGVGALSLVVLLAQWLPQFALPVCRT